MEHPLLDKITTTYNGDNAHFKLPLLKNRGNLFSVTDTIPSYTIVGNFNHDCCEFVGGFNRQTCTNTPCVYPFFYPKEIGLGTVEECNHYHESLIKPYIKFLNKLGMPIIDLGVQFLTPDSLHLSTEKCVPVFMFRMDSSKFVNKIHALASFTCLRYLWYSYFRGIPQRVLEYQSLFEKKGISVTPSFIIGLAHWQTKGLTFGKSLFALSPYFALFNNVVTDNDFIKLCSKAKRIQSIFREHEEYCIYNIDDLMTPDFKSKLFTIMASCGYTSVRKTHSEYNSYNGFVELCNAGQRGFKEKAYNLHVGLIDSLHSKKSADVVERKLKELSNFFENVLKRNKL